MAFISGANWPLNSYTNSTWTTLVTGPAVVSSIIAANNGANDCNVEMRIEASAVSLTQFLPTSEILSGDSYTLDMRSLLVETGQTLQIRSDASGMEFFASGAE